MIAEDVLCPFCGCLCDDIKVEVEEGKIVGVKRACRLGSSKILGHERTAAPMARGERGEEGEDRKSVV